MEMRGEIKSPNTSGFPIQQIGEKTIEVIPVIQEELHIEKNIVEKGKLLIHKRITSEENEINIPLTQEEYKVERILVNEFLENPPLPVRYEDETMIIPVVREVYVKRLLLVEEIRITKQVQTKQFKETITVRSEEVIIEKKENS
jgi:uncharacterized protein (TIGR02271 family)